MTAFIEWRQRMETTHGKYVHEYNTFEVAKCAHADGRASMKREILAIFGPDLLARDNSLQKIVKCIEGME